jgi:hypothetical protein
MAWTSVRQFPGNLGPYALPAEKQDREARKWGIGRKSSPVRSCLRRSRIAGPSSTIPPTADPPQGCRLADASSGLPSLYNLCTDDHH